MKRYMTTRTVANNAAIYHEDRHCLRLRRTKPSDVVEVKNTSGLHACVWCADGRRFGERSWWERVTGWMR